MNAVTTVASPNVSKIEKMFADEIFKATQNVVEVTSRGGDKWTISGSDEDAANAADWMEGTQLMQLEDSVYSDELETRFCYMVAA